MSQLVDEALKREREPIAFRRQQRPGRDTRRDERRRELHVGDETRGKIIRPREGGRRGPVAAAERNKMIAERDEGAIAVEASLRALRGRVATNALRR
jgi:hypothetical protein